MAKRRESLIPLSREHHFALVLCLRIHRGVPNHVSDLAWLKKQAEKTIAFFDGSLVPHFHSEEADLFPAMNAFPDASALINVLLKEHNDLRADIPALRTLILESSATALAEKLMRFADLLELHIRKEERQLFPLYEEHVSPELDKRVGEAIFNRAGTAMQPKDPRLLT